MANITVPPPVDGQSHAGHGQQQGVVLEEFHVNSNMRALQPTMTRVIRSQGVSIVEPRDTGQETVHTQEEARIQSMKLIGMRIVNKRRRKT